MLVGQLQSSRLLGELRPCISSSLDKTSQLIHQSTTYIAAQQNETLPHHFHGRVGLPLPGPEHPRLEPSQVQRPERMFQKEQKRRQRHREILLEEQGYGQSPLTARPIVIFH